jgi:hypothetical protein
MPFIIETERGADDGPQRRAVATAESVATILARLDITEWSRDVVDPMSTPDGLAVVTVRRVSWPKLAELAGTVDGLDEPREVIVDAYNMREV